MKQQRTIDFDNNYLALTFTSASAFSVYFIGFVFILNLIYMPQAIKDHGLFSILVILFYFILTSIVLIPLLILLNTIIGLSVKKIMRFIYRVEPLLGFIFFPAIMSIIAALVTYAGNKVTGSIQSFDYYFLYFATWVSTIMQYIYILRNIKKPTSDRMTEKQITFLKKSTDIDYFS